ncbi:MAG: histidine phosphatase family protein [Spirochaetales bacterium]|nr:histidine phosphatase family protein [Spirochaetales bacterium]
MKHLTIIRHGRAQQQSQDESDIERPLTEDGVSASCRLGELLAARHCVPDIVLTSEAVRARQTAENVCKAAGVGNEKIFAVAAFYENDLNDIAAVLQDISSNYDHVFVVGHNPSLTELVNALCGPVIETMKTASAAGVELHITSWQEVVSGDATLGFYIAG